MTGTMDLAIVIVNWNAGEALRACIQSIQLSHPHVRYQVLVIDNASTDGSREQVERDFPEVRVINSGGNIGFGKANNLARGLVNSSFVLFLNPDSVLTPGALDKMVSLLGESAEVGAVGCKMRYGDGTLWEQLVQRFPTPFTEFLSVLLGAAAARVAPRLFPYLNPEQSGYATKLCGGCLMARRTILDTVGWFDERYFMYAEDADLSQSILEQGSRLFYLSDAEISHAGGESSSKTLAEFPVLMRCESVAKLMRKYYGAVGHFNYLLGLVAAVGVRLLAAVLIYPFVWLAARSKTLKVVDSIRKHCLMLQWCAGLKRPVVPSIQARLEPRSEVGKQATVSFPFNPA